MLDANPDDPEAIPPGAARLLRAALRAPDPPPDAEAASQARVLSAYEAARLDPRPLNPETWTADAAAGITSRFARFVRRLRKGAP